MKTLSLRRHAVHALPAAALLLASFIVPSTARADVSPPDPDSCTGPLGSPKAEGSPCASKGTSGTCEYAETRYLPIPNIRDEAGAPSRSIRCVDKSGNVLDLVSGEEAVKSDPPDGGAGAGGATSASSSSTKSGCTISPVARLAGPWCLAFIVPALAFGLRRRRNTRSS